MEMCIDQFESAKWLQCSNRLVNIGGIGREFMRFDRTRRAGALKADIVRLMALRKERFTVITGAVSNSWIKLLPETAKNEVYRLDLDRYLIWHRLKV